MNKKKLVATFMVGGVALGSLQLTPTFASEDTSDQVQEQKTEARDSISRNNKALEKLGISIEGKSAADILKELLYKKANELGISIEGKSFEAIQIAILKEEAQKAGISIEGKDEATLIKELKGHLTNKKPTEEQLRRISERDTLQKTKFQSFLKENGISAEGKNLEDLQLEILVTKAKELGIATEGKSMKDLRNEIQSKLLIQKANEMGISTKGKDEDTLIKELKEALQRNE